MMVPPFFAALMIDTSGRPPPPRLPSLSSSNNDGSLWDVESGQAKSTFCNRKMGYQVKFHPTDNNIFLMAASDNKIYQWDVRTGAVCQEYNYHLQPCSTVTFFDEGRRFVSTSDDKKILVWEFDIPVPIKYIQDPSMHR
jgi:pre-mRNA-processing factor 17